MTIIITNLLTAISMIVIIVTIAGVVVSIIIIAIKSTLLWLPSPLD